MPDVRITDPQRIRALAHPLRLQLMDLLGEGDLTATQCAERTGESVASCSFHLRMLAKYGYIEAGQRRGREKPWKLVTRSLEIRPAKGDPLSRRAVETMAELFILHEVERSIGWVRSFVDESDDWIEASTACGNAFWATSEELAEVSRALQDIADRFSGRVEDPSKRPPGARPVRVFATAGVDIEQERRIAGAPEARGQT
jgi:DNA-binding transcriptional ArsR family regulator